LIKGSKNSDSIQVSNENFSEVFGKVVGP